MRCLRLGNSLRTKMACGRFISNSLMERGRERRERLGSLASSSSWSGRSPQYPSTVLGCTCTTLYYLD